MVITAFIDKPYSCLHNCIVLLCLIKGVIFYYGNTVSNLKIIVII